LTGLFVAFTDSRKESMKHNPASQGKDPFASRRQAGSVFSLSSGKAEEENPVDPVNLV